MSRTHTATGLLAEHPRLRTAALAVLLLAGQAGLVAAGNGAGYPGP